MKLKILLASCILLSNLPAVGEAGAIFLLISPGAGPQGTGEAQVAKANDVYASYYNPAGFGFLKGREAAGMHVQWLPNLADDLFYEFIAYRQYIEGLGSIGGHIIFLNLGEQIGMDEFNKPTSNWSSFMAAFTGSFGTQLSPTSSIGFNFKVFHQKLAEHTTANEEGKPYSTDFGFDVGYLKKFKRTSQTLKEKKEKKINHLFNQFAEFYDQQIKINDNIYGLWENESNIYEIVENQEMLMDEMDIQKEKLSSWDKYEVLDEKIIAIISQMGALIDSLNGFHFQNKFPTSAPEETVDKKNDIAAEVDPLENIISISENISYKILDIESLKENILIEIEEMEIKEDTDDMFNLGFCISNIGPKIDFVEPEQGDPSPMNMRMGLFAQLYNDGNNKINFLFDINKLLVTRYQMMDWDGDGIVGGYNESGTYNPNLAVESTIYNAKGKKEYDSKGYFDDPWYLSIFTAWLDGWYLGGDIDYNYDRKIGGYTCNGQITHSHNDEYICDEKWVISDEDDWGTTDYPKYGINDADTTDTKAFLELGSGDNRSFTDEFKNMIYNVGLEYWYTDNFVLRAGYIYDDEGKVINPTFGAGIRLVQYGFDFGYTAGETGHPRANTMFFSINIKL